jgi:hypothetical protein
MIWDCFLYYNERDLLDVRLHELEGVVDRFVLVESITTHSGKPKPLYFEQVKREYEDWPITHVVVSDPALITDEWSRRFHPNNSMDWARENHQRNCILRGLREASLDDVVMISDLDEIPRAERVMEGVKALVRPNDCAILWQDMYYYYLDAKAEGEAHFLATRMLRKADLDRSTPQEVRWRGECAVIKDAGWHFGWLGGVERCLDKLEAFAHQELNRAELKDEGYLDYCLRVGQTLHSGKRLHRVPTDRHPRYILEHLDRYGRYFAPETIPAAP